MNKESIERYATKITAIVRKNTVFNISNLYVLEDGSESIVIRDVYKINETSNMVDMVEYGTWNSSTGMSVKEKNIWKRRSNLKGYTFRFIRISTTKF